ncbi:hypothetical protein Kpol_1014p13 [Vanderwaltozyma polyspora DSM 70294]|uniref:Uncharacterized protein n=1 Tax=Vanderwaltozyma polyspora (strain ATCC 22028 / DSM 70294 / BCRC 21397 / CBS 2163 / NBRC 10782 / NRRL Y-8283 / UCD 57-17) TaxID=436907 RepID=A7TNE2_VANPO|nr:uncharacterized protein Kpol_1014p13 [Vanderwaltozyma polyspora DSM 70294]EDO16195.1 hypothetical protein Kpol_1014p13 [Vanderwaltozyma polyspora DSM 70294]
MDVLLHAHLLLTSDVNEISGDYNTDAENIEFTKLLLSGKSYLVVNRLLDTVGPALDVNNTENLIDKLSEYVSENIIRKLDGNKALILAIALLQTFIQNNYTGPLAPIEINKLVLNNAILENSDVNLALVNSLTVLGQACYELTDSPILLVLSLILLEAITNQPSLFKTDQNEEAPIVTINREITSSMLAIAHWWRARALMAHLSLLPEPSGLQPIVASSILSSIDLAHSVVKELPEFVEESLKKKIYTIYYLENVKCSLVIQTEHLCLPSLIKVMKLTDFKFVLTGARAKRTKFQEKAHSGLIILAQSSSFLEMTNTEADKSNPSSFELNSDILLEKPIFESIGSEPLDEQIVKKQKLDDEEQGLEEDKILPVAIRQENIPVELQALDPNDQPALSDYDNIQLLLRLYTIRQTSPAKDPLVEEELSAIISRIIYQSGNKNWSIFSRSLWERSIIETTKAKTIERGLLQMQSLVEELGIQITTRLIPQNADEESQQPTLRLKFIHQLPYMPRWELDSTLAEKFMSVGILKSAVEIYERLQMSCEAALCYAAVGDEKKAEEILLQRVEKNPNDARAYSILGDIRQDPTLWEKSWEIGKYVNAKNSLAKYYYNPPSSSGLQRDYVTALKHLNDSLRQYTLNFETWYFYGCLGLECGKMDLAAEAFSRCVSLDDTHAMAWSNLSASYIEQGKLKEAFSCLKRATSCDSQKNWRIWENFLIVAVKLNEWDDVLFACRHLVSMNRDKNGEKSIDLPVVEKLVDLLISTDYIVGEEQKLTHFQRSCVDFICNILPTVITTSARCWRLVARVELWRKRPWAALDCHEKAYRAASHNSDIEIDENVWNDTVVACEDLVAAYESLGEMEGRHGSGSLVCKDWKYKARAAIKALMSKGKNRWDDSDGWEKLLELRNSI